MSTSHLANLEGLSVDGPQALFVVLPLRHPHLLESVEGGQDAAADPRRVQPLLRGADPDLNVFGRQLLHLRQEAVAEPFEEGRAAGEHYVLE